MNINEEKSYCYQMMKDITEERRRLSEMYMSLKVRVDELNRLEEKGVAELSTKGFFDMFNDRETHIQITNVNREANAVINPPVEKVEKVVEKDIPVPRYDKKEQDVLMTQKEKELERERQKVREAAEKQLQEVIVAMEKENEAKKQVAATQLTIPLAEIEIAKEKDAKYKPKTHKPKPEPKEPGKRGPKPGTPRGRRVSSGISTDEANVFIEQILKEHGKPLHREKLWEAVVIRSGANQLSMQNFVNNILLRVMKKNSKIVKATEQGFYQFKE